MLRLGQRLQRVAIASHRHARGDGRHRGRVQRVAGGRPLERRQRQLAGIQIARPGPAHCNALAAQHHRAGRRAAAHRAAVGIGHALGTAQRDSVGFHHRGQHRLAGLDAQPVEGALHVLQDTLNGQGQLHGRSRYSPQRGLRARLHLGGSFGLLARQPAWSHAGQRSRHLSSCVQQIAGHHPAAPSAARVRRNPGAPQPAAASANAKPGPGITETAAGLPLTRS